MRTLTLLTPILGEYTNNAKRIVEKRAVKVAYQKRPDYEMLLNQTGLYPLHKGNLEPFVTMDQDHVNFVMDVFEHDLESDSPCTLEPRWSTTS
jgi:hypothetical protein